MSDLQSFAWRTRQTPVGAGPVFDRERLSGDRPREGVLPPLFVSGSPVVAGAADC